MRGTMFTLIRLNAWAFCVGTVLAGSVPSIAAADAASSDSIKLLQQKLDQSIKMIDALAARVKELEAKQAAMSASASPQPAPAEESRLHAVEQQISQIEIANAARQSDDTGLAVHGFADVNIGNHNPFHPYEKGANLNNLDLYLTPKL